MIYYDRIDVSKGIDVNKTSKLKECDICHYWYEIKGFKFQSYIYYRCHDLVMMSMNLYSKSEAINLLQNIDLTKKSEHYKT